MISFIKNILNKIWKYLCFDIDYSSSENTPKKVSKYKKRDTTKFTQQDYDLIMEQYRYYLLSKSVGEKENKMTQEDLTHKLNSILGLDKSRNAYRKVWEGKIKREDLNSQLSLDLK